MHGTSSPEEVAHEGAAQQISRPSAGFAVRALCDVLELQIISHFQMTIALTRDGTLGHGENLNSPEMQWISNTMEWVNVDPFIFPGMECFGLSHFKKMYISVATLFGIIFLLRLLLRVGVINRGAFFSYAITVITLAFPNLCAMIMKSLQCRELAGR